MNGGMSTQSKDNSEYLHSYTEMVVNMYRIAQNIATSPEKVSTLSNGFVNVEGYLSQKEQSIYPEKLPLREVFESYMAIIKRVNAERVPEILDELLAVRKFNEELGMASVSNADTNPVSSPSVATNRQTFETQPLLPSMSATTDSNYSLIQMLIDHIKKQDKVLNDLCRVVNGLEAKVVQMTGKINDLLSLPTKVSRCMQSLIQEKNCHGEVLSQLDSRINSLGNNVTNLNNNVTTAMAEYNGLKGIVGIILQQQAISRNSMQRTSAEVLPTPNATIYYRGHTDSNGKTSSTSNMNSSLSRPSSSNSISNHLQASTYDSLLQTANLKSFGSSRAIVNQSSDNRISNAMQGSTQQSGGSIQSSKSVLQQNAYSSSLSPYIVEQTSSKGLASNPTNVVPSLGIRETSGSMPCSAGNPPENNIFSSSIGTASAAAIQTNRNISTNIQRTSKTIIDLSRDSSRNELHFEVDEDLLQRAKQIAMNHEQHDVAPKRNFLSGTVASNIEKLDLTPKRFTGNHPNFFLASTTSVSSVTSQTSVANRVDGSDKGPVNLPHIASPKSIVSAVVPPPTVNFRGKVLNRSSSISSRGDVQNESPNEIRPTGIEAPNDLNLVNNARIVVGELPNYVEDDVSAITEIYKSKGYAYTEEMRMVLKEYDQHVLFTAKEVNPRLEFVRQEVSLNKLKSYFIKCPIKMSENFAYDFDNVLQHLYDYSISKSSRKSNIPLMACTAWWIRLHFRSLCLERLPLSDIKEELDSSSPYVPARDTNMAQISISHLMDPEASSSWMTKSNRLRYRNARKDMSLFALLGTGQAVLKKQLLAICNILRKCSESSDKENVCSKIMRFCEDSCGEIAYGFVLSIIASEIPIAAEADMVLAEYTLKVLEDITFVQLAYWANKGKSLSGEITDPAISQTQVIPNEKLGCLKEDISLAENSSNAVSAEIVNEKLGCSIRNTSLAESSSKPTSSKIANASQLCSNGDTSLVENSSKSPTMEIANERQEYFNGDTSLAVNYSKLSSTKISNEISACHDRNVSLVENSSEIIAVPNEKPECSNTSALLPENPSKPASIEISKELPVYPIGNISFDKNCTESSFSSTPVSACESPTESEYDIESMEGSVSDFQSASHIELEGRTDGQSNNKKRKLNAMDID